MVWSGTHLGHRSFEKVQNDTKHHEKYESAKLNLYKGLRHFLNIPRNDTKRPFGHSGRRGRRFKSCRIDKARKSMNKRLSGFFVSLKISGKFERKSHLGHIWDTGIQKPYISRAFQRADISGRQ